MEETPVLDVNTLACGRGASSSVLSTLLSVVDFVEETPLPQAKSITLRSRPVMNIEVEYHVMQCYASVMQHASSDTISRTRHVLSFRMEEPRVT